MANSYYNYSGSFIPGTLARAEAIAAEYSSVATGFSKLSIQGTDTGTANHYAFATPGYPVAAYQDGNNVQFKALNTNTGASDVNVNGIGIVPLTRFNGAALLAGDVSAGSWYTAVYQVAFGAFTIISPAAYTTFAGTISGAAPANKVGLVAAGGSATSAIPIDATLAIDQAIIPTWTGLHTFNGKVVVGAPASGVGLTVTGVAGASAAQFLTTGVQIGSPTGGDKGSGTLNVASGLYVNGTLVASGAIVTSIVAGTAISISGATGAVTVNNTGVTSITGTANQIAASASTGAVTLSMPQNVIIPTPASGVALTVNGNSTSPTINSVNALAGNAINNFQNTSNSASALIQVQVLNDAGNVFAMAENSSTATAGVITGAANGTGATLYTGSAVPLYLATAGTSRIAIGSAGNVTVNAPSSGVALAIIGVGGTTATLTVDGNPVYAGIPQNIQNGNYTLVLADANKHILHNTVSGPHTYTIPANASVAFPVGTAITIINPTSAGGLSIAITTDTLQFYPSGGSGTRTLAANGQATILKLTSTVWAITGVGIT